MAEWTIDNVAIDLETDIGVEFVRLTLARPATDLNANEVISVTVVASVALDGPLRQRISRAQHAGADLLESAAAALRAKADAAA